MPAPMPFALHAQLQRVLCVTAVAWGLSVQQRRLVRRAPQFGFAISY
ncbi:hypothetical protein [Acidovorax carolinensis]|nr:hypothetical protein [Acidovorax carolinensis]